MSYLRLLSIVLLFSISVAAIADPIQERINKCVKDHYNVGIAVIVIESTNVRHYFAGTLSKMPSARPVDKDTIFPLASMTKVFTTLALAEQVVLGKIKLDAPAQNCMPIGLTLPTYKGDPIRIVNLATHTAGMPAPHNISHGNPFATLNQIKEFLKNYKLPYPPGSHYLYSNLSISLLAQCLSTLSGESYEVFMKNNICLPLNMTETYFQVPEYRKNNLVTGYLADGKEATYWQFKAMNPAGGLFSSPKDLANFLKANLGLMNTSLYPAMKLAHKPFYSEGKNSRNLGLPKGTIVFSSLGWNVYENLVWKTGNYPGFSSFIGLRTDKKLGVVVLANTGNIAYTNNLGMHILDASIELLPTYKAIHLSENQLKGLTGTYQIKNGDTYQLQVEDSSIRALNLSVPITMRNYFALYPMEKDKFFALVDDSVFTFFRNKEGEVTGFTLTEDGKISTGTKVGSRQDVSNSVLINSY